MKFEITYVTSGKPVTITQNDSNLEVIFDQKNVRNIVTLKANKRLTVVSAKLSLDFQFKESDALFCNGYQSCTDTQEFGIHDKLNNLKQIPGFGVKMFSFKSYGDIAFYEYQKNVLHGWDVGYIRGDENLFIGNNNYKWAGLIIEFHVEKNKIVLVDDINNVVLNENEEKVFFDFNLEKFEDLNHLEYFNQFKPRTTKKIVGYSSWYNHFDKINESILIENLKAVDKKYFNLFQIDDGYESKVGDWKVCDHSKFPNGLRSVVEKIHEKELMAGIWVAPFVAQEGSKLLETHPDWFKKDSDGKMIKCGSNWGGFYALDFYNEHVREYIKDCLLFFKDLGFDYFKLDFLYAVSLPVYEGKNRSKVATEAYSFLREILGDSLILGNSCVMAPAFGVFDFVRVGPSVTTEWDDSWLMRKMHRERNSTKHTILNTISRSIFNGRVFLNDPDVFLLRRDIGLSYDQKKSLATINALFGSVLTTSDDITTYDRLYPNYDKKAAAILEETLDIAQSAENVSFRKKGSLIEISYDLKDRTHVLSYDPETGISKEI